MDNSLSTWLQLREPADAAARSDGLTRTIADALATGETVQVLDLATGTGSNLRYLAPRLPGRQRWLDGRSRLCSARAAAGPDVLVGRCPLLRG